MNNLWEVQGWLYDTMFLLKPHAGLVQDVAGRLNPESRVLDAGCGSGRLALDTSAQVIGCDFSSTMLRLASQRESAVVQSSVLGELAFARESFDEIVCINVLYALGYQYKQALDELYRVLRPGGRLYLANPVSERLVPLITEHFQTASPREIARSVVNLPRFAAWGLNLARRGQFDASTFLFLSEEELVCALQSAGFTIKSVEPTYAGIDRLVVAGKD